MTEFEWLESEIEALSQYVRGRYAERGTVRVDTKKDASDLLTEVDLTVQQRLSNAIRERFPGDAIVAEEAGQHEYPADPEARCWVIDPIDGTQNFVRGYFPIFGISAAFVVRGVPECGIVDLPNAGLRFSAARGRGAYCNAIRLCASKVDRVPDARIEVDFGARPNRNGGLERFHGILREAGAVRCLGSAAVGLCSVASGDGDAYLNVALAPWDYAAGILIVQESGGHATRLDGRAIHMFDAEQGVVATNGLLHGAVLSEISD